MKNKAAKYWNKFARNSIDTTHRPDVKTPEQRLRSEEMKLGKQTRRLKDSGETESDR